MKRRDPANVEDRRKMHIDGALGLRKIKTYCNLAVCRLR